MPMKPPVHGCKPKPRAQSYRDYDNGKRKSDPSLALAKKIRSSSHWQKMQRRVLRKYPLCCDPFKDHANKEAYGINEHGEKVLIKGETAPSEQGHHVIGLREMPELAFVMSNCRGICMPCHDRIEKMHRAGKTTQEYFIHV